MDVKSFQYLGLSAALALLFGCNTVPVQQPNVVTTEVAVLEYQIKRGDTLAKISQRLTGNPDNWQAIAHFNRLSDPRLIRTGKQLLIPAELLLPETKQNASLENPWVVAPLSETVKNDTAAADIKPGALVFQATEVPGLRETPVMTQPVSVNKKFQVTLAGSTTEKLNHGDRVMIQVVGTYYPKGVYAQPFNHSPLMMRAQPGDTFELNQELGDWLRINTKNGAGYIRARDAKVVGDGYAGDLQSEDNNT